MEFVRYLGLPGGLDAAFSNDGKLITLRNYLDAAAFIVGPGNSAGASVLSGCLYIGSAAFAEDPGTLGTAGISDVFSYAGVDSVWSETITYRSCILSDALGSSPLPHFHSLIRIIESDIHGPMWKMPEISLQDIGKRQEKKFRGEGSRLGVCINCHLGISRSGIAVVLYLLYRFYVQGTLMAPLDLVKIMGQQCRRIIPNASFLTQAQAVYECLKVLDEHAPVAATAEEDEKKARSDRFHTVVDFCSAYYRHQNRVFADTIAFIKTVVIGGLIDLCKEAEKKKSRLWSLKKSVFKDSTLWILPGAILRTLQVYLDLPDAAGKLAYLANIERDLPSCVDIRGNLGDWGEEEPMPNVLRDYKLSVTKEPLLFDMCPEDRAAYILRHLGPASASKEEASSLSRPPWDTKTLLESTVAATKDYTERIEKLVEVHGLRSWSIFCASQVAEEARRVGGILETVVEQQMQRKRASDETVRRLEAGEHKVQPGLRSSKRLRT